MSGSDPGPPLPPGPVVAVAPRPVAAGSVASPPVVVVAVGGNALLQRGQRAEIEVQRVNVAAAASSLAALADGWRLVVTHGNGPQVGVLADTVAAAGAAPVPLDVLDAETQGQIGYQLELELRNALGAGRELAVLLTQVEVDPADPAFAQPTKPIGPWLDEAGADAARRRGWTLVERVGLHSAPRSGTVVPGAASCAPTPSSVAGGADGVGQWRRVVPSPRPVATLERAVVAELVASGVVVVCGGGGGIPVALDEGGRWHGVEAVVDKDRAAALLAIEIGAAALVIVTDVDGVYRRWGRPDAELVREATVAELRAMTFDAGSMGPKVDAACTFVERTGRPASIGSLTAAPQLLAGTAGTRILP